MTTTTERHRPTFGAWRNDISFMIDQYNLHSVFGGNAEGPVLADSYGNWHW